MFDFSDARAQFGPKEEKRRVLVDIMDHVSTSKEKVFTPPVYAPLFEMFRVNLFRALPIGSSNQMFHNPEDDEPFLEPSWPHLQVVYELLRKFVVSPDTEQKLVRKHVSSRFVLSMVELFNSEDPREREYLKTVLHRIYGKIMQPRPFIRRSIMNVFHRFVYETHRHNGIAELLEIIGSIINGFAVPLKEEHKNFLRSFLLPLITPKGLPSYHVQLSFCITQFVDKEPDLACDVVRGLDRHWPITHSHKEVMLLNELEELLELTQPDHFAPVIELLFKRIGKCIESPHFQVAERALFFWNNEYIVSLIVYFRTKIVPLVFGPLHRNVQSHWNPNVLSLSFNVQKLLSEMDGALYKTAAEQYFTNLEDRERNRTKRIKRWVRLRRKNGEDVPESVIEHEVSAARAEHEAQSRIIRKPADYDEDDGEGDDSDSDDFDPLAGLNVNVLVDDDSDDSADDGDDSDDGSPGPVGLGSDSGDEAVETSSVSDTENSSPEARAEEPGWRASGSSGASGEERPVGADAEKVG